MKIIGLIGVISIGVFLMYSQFYSARAYAQPAQIDPSLRALLPEEREITDKTMRLFSQNLMLVTMGHERGEELFRLFVDHHIPLVIEQLGNGRTVTRVERSTNSTQFSFFAEPWDEEETFASYLPQHRELRIGTKLMSNCFFGFIAAHEMVHVDDFVSGRESPAPSGSDEFVAGEIRAHELEFELIERWTRGRFWTTIGRVERRLAKVGRATPFTEDMREVDALFPPSESDIERRMRNGIYVLAISFSRIERFGLPDAYHQKIRAYRETISAH